MNIPLYNISDESKEANEYFFWVRPTSEWNCTATEFKKTFDALDEVAVQYETTRFESAFNALLTFSLFQFFFHTFFAIFLLIKIYSCNRKHSTKFYGLFKITLLLVELISLVIFVVTSQDAI